MTAVIRTFENPQKLLTLFNPDYQISYTADLRRAYLGKAPSLGLVGRAFGTGTAKSWAAIQLWNLAEFSGVKQKLTERQIDELAEIVRVQYGFMKLTELMDFFRRFKLGEFGKFYGAVDPLVITTALREFAAKRLAILNRLEREEEEERRCSDSREIILDRKIRRSYEINCFYADNFRATDFALEEFREIWWLFNLGYERDNHGYTERQH